MYTHDHNRGITVIEALLGIAIIALVLVFVSQTMTLFFNSSGDVREKTKALYLAEEGIEVLRYIRDEDWNEVDVLTQGATYYFDIATTTLATTTTPEVIDGIYTRSFTVENTERDGNNDFVETGGTDDTGGRVVTVDVAWGSESVSLSSILTNIQDI